MITGRSLQSAPGGQGKQSRKVLKRSAWLASALLVVYAVLLIPVGEEKYTPTKAEQLQRPVFAWNQDAYWKTLETRYRTLKQGGCATAVPRLNAKFQDVNKILSRLQQTRLRPAAPVYRELESLVFEMGPMVSACHMRVMDYIALIAEMRSVIKQQSVEWDVHSAAVRTTLYRLLYGTRAAAEEVILQSPPGVVSPLVLGKNEPSQTPFADVRNVRVHSGDILVSRGGAPTSALIARGNDYPGNFSHIALVYINPDTHTPFIVEALIEEGVVVSTVEQYLKGKKLRVMLLRFRADLPQLRKDPMIPHKAALRAYTQATTGHVCRQGQAGEVIAREETLLGKVTVGIKIPFVNAFSFGKEANLAFCLGSQAAGVLSLGFRPGMVSNDFVMQFALVNRSPVKTAPSIAGGIK